MVFSSQLFVFCFLPLALCVYYALPARGRQAALTILSYIFYGWSNPAFLLLLMFSTVLDYTGGLVISQNGLRWPSLPPRQLDSATKQSRLQRWTLIACMTGNLCLLGFFKYFNFAVDNYNALLAALGFAGLRFDDVLRVTLPLGISFYTFQTMSYTIDVYRGKACAIRNFVDFACFVSMFPQLVAGPIVRFTDVSDQLRHRSHTLERFARGAAMFSVGMAKKILLANPCGKVADTVFSAGSITSFDAWYGVVAYSFQIYFDFSAYSDMAIGLGLMFGFVFPKNFDSPYRSESITEFWRRWHISLSTWLRDYLFLPVSYAILRRVQGDRVLRFFKTESFAYTSATMLTMFLGGLWHGAAWHFVLWGAMHGVWLAIDRMALKRSAYRRVPRPFRVGITFLLVMISWVFFRADSIAHAAQYCMRMVGAGECGPGAVMVGGIIHNPYYLSTLIIAAAVTWTCPQTWDWTRNLSWQKALLSIILLSLSLGIMTTQAYNPFIYFIF
ncbi:MAG: MBOAT family O-acyltransferase [Acidobacteriota bacterium]